MVYYSIWVIVNEDSTVRRGEAYRYSGPVGGLKDLFRL